MLDLCLKFSRLYKNAMNKLSMAKIAFTNKHFAKKANNKSFVFNQKMSAEFAKKAAADEETTQKLNELDVLFNVNAKNLLSKIRLQSSRTDSFVTINNLSLLVDFNFYFEDKF
ncbi:hypothetical protein MHBO_002688 [Bonamia ostreae]|uniref:Uncharacterized protein n=1 Tax=Bonamia ostreae TaxID=126728 RepID=A0ABV2AN74_9EUKA